MAAHEMLGRQFLDRHLVEHHGWNRAWLEDYDEAPEEGHTLLSMEHKMDHMHGISSTNAGGYSMTPHTHGPDQIHFH